MIIAKKALKIILAHSNPIGIEEREIVDSFGCVLAENIYSDIYMPPFDRSAMDGFAINSKDPSKVFEIIEDIPAGTAPKKKIHTGQCARIMTGAMLPLGADKVVKVEDARLISDHALRVTHYENKTNISKNGEDIKAGKKILNIGVKIRPQEIAMLAAVGKTMVKVFRRPRISIISTGSELVEPSLKPKIGQIRNSNSSMILAQLKRRGICGKYLGIARDKFDFTVKLIKKGLENSDILLLSGGVSVGDYDFVKEALKKCEVKIHFNKIAVKPGKPTVFGTKGEKLIFGLPGNPVSVFAVFELFVVPALDKIVGRKAGTNLKKYILLNDFIRRDANREQYFPIMLGEKGVKLIAFHGSAHILALTKANGLMQIKKGIKKIKKGTMVDVRPV
ncbi:MAG: hypothetical protein FD145_1428 [Candidatus Saganbacteria bacterium]|uniref:Molybdopterin molybdenumtransferase n=1 Tax=Candidatus Saganbacteria bacterium TaxID=2575572 RepID=A0A833L063_UNCSA|nr:MAG: hypothetical protein FD145_1428 [Candidatus Saganbacteria bacterium]